MVSISTFILSFELTVCWYKIHSLATVFECMTLNQFWGNASKEGIKKEKTQKQRYKERLIEKTHKKINKI